MSGKLSHALTLIFVCLNFAGCAGHRVAPTSKAVTIVAVNDVYRISGVDNGSNGGIARVRTLRNELEGEGHDVILLHAGDFLYPSLLSRKFDGEHMIDALNYLDGTSGTFDEKFVVTFGNHEFDKSSLRDSSILQSRIGESDFTWLGTNIRFANDNNGNPHVSGSNLRDQALFDMGKLKIGVFSITTDVKHPDYVSAFADPVETAREATKKLRDQGANFVIGLTHQEMGADRRLLAALRSDGPDLVVGGHEHNRQMEKIQGRKIVKADADARSAAVIRVKKRWFGRPKVSVEFRMLNSVVQPDPTIVNVTRNWQQKFSTLFCQQAGSTPDCLDLPIGRTQVELVGEELEIRRFETNLGNWVADEALKAFSSRGAQVAFVNSGSLRLNQNIPAGAEISERHLAEIFAYPSPMSLIEISGATLTEILEHSIDEWTGNGWWLQLSGVAFRFDPDAGTVTDLTLVTQGGSRSIAPSDKLLAVTNDFLLNPAYGQDGYTMIAPSNRVDPAAPRPDLRDLVRTTLANSGSNGIAPSIDGRICNTQRPGPCLAVTSP